MKLSFLNRLADMEYGVEGMAYEKVASSICMLGKASRQRTPSALILFLFTTYKCNNVGQFNR